ncbi:sensor histidine kinase [Ekhidna sp.]
MQEQIELLEIGSIAIFAAYNIVLFLQVRRRYYLYLSLICFVIFMRATLVDDGSMIFYTFFPNISLTMGRKIEFFCGYAGVPIMLLFFNSLYTFQIFRKFVNAFLVVTGGFILFVLLTPYKIFYHTLDIYNIIILLSYVLVFAILGKAVKKHQTGSLYVLMGAAFCFLFVMAELLKVSGVVFIDAGPNLVNSGFIVFLFFQSIALSEIFAKSFKENQELNKNLEKRVEEKTSQLSRSNLLRETLIRIISHDLRGPLGNLKSIVSLFQSEQIGIDKAKEFMANVDSGVDHSIQMLDELIEWGHAASQNKKIEQEEIKVEEILVPAIGQMRHHIDTKEISLSFTGKTDGVCLFDKNAIKVVVRNLLSNAVKFTEKGGTIDIEVFENGKFLEVSFRDNGIGIPASMKENLFQMKKDNKRPGTDNEKSSGVGLFICKDLIEQNGGSINSTDNPEGKGTVFNLTIQKAS